MMRARAFLLLGLLSLGACAHDTIPNTDVEDSPEARDVIKFVEVYRSAVVKRDVGKLVSLAAEDYFDDMGTPQGDDDVDREGLATTLKTMFGPDLLAVHYDIKYRDVVFLPTKVLVDYTYIGRFRVNSIDGVPRWERRLADNRMILTKDQGGEYKIASGM
ncbi:MAG: hypothetical protein QM778_19275 [Myxococcales bacterium]